MTYYAALDVGLRTTAVCIVDGNGEIQLEKSLASEVDDIVTCLRGFGAEIASVGLEAGTLTQWLTYGLRAAGFSPVVMEARHVKAALGAMRNKTDRNDARGIAQILRTGWYREVYVKSLESHYVRTLLASRKALLRKCIDLENEVRGLAEGVRHQAACRHPPRCLRCGDARADRSERNVGARAHSPSRCSAGTLQGLPGAGSPGQGAGAWG